MSWNRNVRRMLWCISQKNIYSMEKYLNTKESNHRTVFFAEPICLWLFRFCNHNEWVNDILIQYKKLLCVSMSMVTTYHIVEAIWTIIENYQLRPGLLRYIVHVNRSDRLTCCMLKFNFAIVYLQNIPFTQLSFFYLPGIFNDTWKILTYDKRIVLTS